MRLTALFLFLTQCMPSSQLYINEIALTDCCYDIDFSPVMSSLVECVNVTLRKGVDAVISQVPYLQGQHG